MNRSPWIVPLTLMLAIAGACRTPAQTGSLAPSDIQRENDATVAKVFATIAGREQSPAGEVFQNVKYLAGTRAGQMLSIMNTGYARALGVRCAYCHIESDFASDAKREKRATREMQTMHRMINQELGKMQNIATPPTSNRAISCIVCHRGTARPRG